MELKIQRIAEVDLPNYAKPSDAALDLRSAADAVLKPGERKVIPTGLKMAIPENHVGLIWDRSGLAAKNGLHCLAGVIDAGYRGEIGVVLLNTGSDEFKIEKNMRIAQILIQPVVQAKISEVNELDETHRGSTGFGSSGLH